MNPLELSIHELAELYSRKEISPVEVTKVYLQSIKKHNPKLNAYISITEELAFEQAKAAEKMIMSNNQNTLTGVPLALKDLICTKGVTTTCGSNILKNFVPPFDATIVAKLRQSGAVFLGKTNMDEFAMGSSNEYSAFGPVLNPWDTSRIPGGSSGGSAAACAAKLCAGAIGSDTGGSIRQPASYCGIVGLKPTYGRVSRFGLVAFASSLDQIGPITRNVTDSALLLEALAGYDPADSTSVPQPVPNYTKSLTQGLKGLKIGLPKEYFVEGLETEVEDKIRTAVKAMEAEGAELVEISLPHTQYAVAAYYIIAPAEASSNLARYDGVKYGLRAENNSDIMDMYLSTRSNGFGPEVTRRIMIGTYVLSAGYYDAYYKKATQVRTLIRQDFDTAFESCDVIACPVTPTAAFKIGEKIDDPLKMYLSDIFTLATNLAGIPGISVPCGLSKNNLPIGIQFMGNHFQEDILLKVAYNYEQISEFTLNKLQSLT